MIRVIYHPSCDAAYIELTDIASLPVIEGETHVAFTYPCAPGDETGVDGTINLDFDSHGRLIGIEVLGASRKLPRDLLEMSEDFAVYELTPEEIQLREAQQELKKREYISAYRADADLVLAELAAAGFPLEPIGVLHQLGRCPRESIPVLVRCLTRITNHLVAYDIVRALSPWEAESLQILLDEFQASREASARRALGEAIEELADDTAFERIAVISKDPRFGREREMLVLALGKMRDPGAPALLLELLDDPEVVGVALRALATLRAPVPKERMEPFLKHSEDWIRDVAKEILRRQSPQMQG